MKDLILKIVEEALEASKAGETEKADRLLKIASEVALISARQSPPVIERPCPLPHYPAYRWPYYPPSVTWNTTDSASKYQRFS